MGTWQDSQSQLQFACGHRGGIAKTVSGPAMDHSESFVVVSHAGLPLGEVLETFSSDRGLMRESRESRVERRLFDMAELAVSP